MIALFAAGLAGGVIGGMGMGGGTLLIPLLTTFCGIEQHTAQAINLVAFIPMSVVSIAIHVKNGLVRPIYLLTVALPAAVTGVFLSFVALNMEGRALSVFFGVFLIVLGVFQLCAAVEPAKRKGDIVL